MYDFVVLTPTFNRAKMMFGLMQTLAAQVSDPNVPMRVAHIVLDDASDFRVHRYREVCPRMSVRRRYEVVYHRMDSNCGREKFWKLWNQMFTMLKQMTFKYAVAIPDDHRICDQFLSTAELWLRNQQKKDATVCAINILPKAKRCWKTLRFVDGAFIADRRFFEALKWQLMNTREWIEGARQSHEIGKPLELRSSGVGRQMTLRIGEQSSRVRIARAPSVALLEAVDCPSAMFPVDQFPDRPRMWGLNNFVGRRRA